MEVKINQKLFDEKGSHFGTPQVTLRDVCCTALLAHNREDEDKTKDDKYRLFLKIAPQIKEDAMIDFVSEEITLIKKSAKFHPPIIRGQMLDMLENKFDPTPYYSLAAYFEANKPKEVEINMEVIAEIRRRLEEVAKMLA